MLKLGGGGRILARTRAVVVSDEPLWPSQALTLSQLKALAPELARRYRTQRLITRRALAAEQVRREKQAAATAMSPRVRLKKVEAPTLWEKVKRWLRRTPR